MSRSKVAFLTNFVSPYRLPVLRRLAEDVDLTVVVNGHTEFDRQWETRTGELNIRVSKTWTRKRTLRHKEPVAFDEVVSQHLPVGLFADLRRIRPDVIISGELGPRSLIATLFGAIYRVPVVLWSYHSRASSAGVGRLRAWVWRTLLKRSKAVVGMGTEAREVLASHGVPDAKIFDAPNAPDVAGIEHRLSTPECSENAQRIKETYGQGKRIAVVLGRLVPLKGIPELLAAWSALPSGIRDGWRLVFVGDGPYRSLVEDHTEGGVIAAGPVSPEEVPDWFRASDLHVFASLGDVWGLVVNESQLCSTPTLSSIHAGCSQDLIVDGENGLLFDPGTPDECLEGLTRALTHHDLARLGAAGRASASRCTTERFAQGFLNALDHVCPRPDRGTGPVQTRRAA